MQAVKRRPRRMANKRLDPLKHSRSRQADMATPGEAVVMALEQRVEKALAKQDLQAIDSSMDALFSRLERSRSRTGHRRQRHIETIERYEHELEHVVESHETKRRAHLVRANAAMHELVLLLRTSHEPNKDSETTMESLLQTAEREYRLGHDTRHHCVDAIRYKIQAQRLMSTACAQFARAQIDDALTSAHEAQDLHERYCQEPWFAPTQLLMSVAEGDVAWTQNSLQAFNDAEKAEHEQIYSNADQYFKGKARDSCETLLTQAKVLAKRHALDEALDSVRRLRIYSIWLEELVPDSVQRLEQSLRQCKITRQLQTTLQDFKQSDFQLVSLVEEWTELLKAANDGGSAIDSSQMIALSVPSELFRSMNEERIQERPNFTSIGLIFIARILSSAPNPKRVFSDAHALKALVTILRSCSEPNLKTITLELLRALLTTKDVVHIAIYQYNMLQCLRETKQASLSQTDAMRALVLLFQSLVERFPVYQPVFEGSGVFTCTIAILGRYYTPPTVDVALPCLELLLWVCRNGRIVDLRASETSLCATLVAALRYVSNVPDQRVPAVRLTSRLMQLIQALNTYDDKAKRSLEAQKAPLLMAKAFKIYGDAVTPDSKCAASDEPTQCQASVATDYRYRSRGIDSFGFAVIGRNNKKTFCLARVLIPVAEDCSKGVECRLQVARFDRKGLNLASYRFRGPAFAGASFRRKLMQLKGVHRAKMLEQAWEAFAPISGGFI